MKTRLILFIPIIVVAAIVGCADQPAGKEKGPNKLFEERVIQGEAQGTTYTVRYLDDTTNYQPAIDSLLDQVDRVLSTWREGSLINQVNAHDRTDTVFAFHDSTLYFGIMFDVSREIWERTEGAFDPTVFPLVELWGFGLSKRQDVTEDMVAEVLPRISMSPSNIDMIEVYQSQYIYEQTQIRKGREGVRLDFNAIAQGFTVDLITELLEQKGVNNFMIELGGEVYCRGVNASGEAWRIAIDKPVAEGEREFSAIARVQNRSIATSGSYRKFYEIDGKRYSHAIDPRTGYPVDHNLLSVTVMADNCMMADAYATAFMVMGLEDAQLFLEEHGDYNFDVYMIYDNGDGSFGTWMSPGMSSIIEEVTNM